MFIEELNIRGYGKLSNFRIEPSHGLNVLQGGAGAGKSTICNCMRDMLVGPGQWDSPEGGPRAPYARPWEGERFQARMRYSVGAQSYTLQRDFDEMTARARDDRTSQEIPMADARASAPGVHVLGTEDGAKDEAGQRERLEQARKRATEAEHDAAAWEYRLNEAHLLDLQARHKKAAEMDAECVTLRPRLEELSKYSAVAREHRDTVIREGARLRSLERELAESAQSVETLQAARREAGQKLGEYEPYFKVTEHDLEMVKNLDLTEGPSNTQVEDKEKNLEGFRAKENDITRRLAEIGPRFERIDNEEEFELRLNEHERELGRSELLTAKVVERDRLTRQIEPLRGSSRRFTIYGVLIILLGGACIGLAIANHAGAAALSVGIILVVTGLLTFVKTVTDNHAARDLESEHARVVGDLEKLKASIDVSREQVRVMLESAGVQTIKELRSQYREFRSLQRDAETVRAYRRELERDLETARQKVDTHKTETPKLLIDCGILTAGEAPTPRAVAEFFDAYHRFRALGQEEDTQKKRLSAVQGEMADKMAARDEARASHAKALAAMGLGSEAEMDDAFAGRREYDRIKAELEVLDEKLRAVLHGRTLADTAAQIGAMQTRRDALLAAHADFATLDVAVDRAEEYRNKHYEAQQAFAKVSGEIAALGGADLDAASDAMQPARLDPDNLTAAITAAWCRITQDSLNARVRESQERLTVEVAAREEGPWTPPATLGSQGARLLAILLEGEVARAGGSAALPAFIDAPFALFETAWHAPLAEWIVELSETVQVFVTLSSADVLTAVLARQGTPFQTTHEEGLDILSAITVQAAEA